MLTTDVLADIMQFRRMADDSCSAMCAACHGPHAAKIDRAIRHNEPITFVLPAFPGKSPSLAKVLGPLPDMAERCSLVFLDQLCARIRSIYAPGACIILCSDGRVFSDAVGMRDEDVTNYQREIAAMIEALGITTISVFNLDDIYAGLSFDAMRAQLLSKHGASLDELRASVHESTDAHRLYCGITRFLLEDAAHSGQTRSRTALQKDCRARAYQVIQRSNAWSNLLEEMFPDAVRLSIHPQACGSKKLGIRLMEAESWMTPWHGVAVKTDGRFILVKRLEAESMGARVVLEGGRPSHYEIAAAEPYALAMSDEDDVAPSSREALS
jgi:pyoverdine/dityrosine biosynthesis protein Dit1